MIHEVKGSNALLHSSIRIQQRQCKRLNWELMTRIKGDGVVMVQSV